MMAGSTDGTGRDSKTIQSVLRAIDVLEVVARSGSSCSISDISAETGIPGPTVFRLLNTMAGRGWVIKTTKREYSVGAAFFALTSSAGSSIGSAMDDVLATLVSRTGESASVAMLDHFNAFYVAHRTSSRAMRLFTRVGNRVPLYATGVGKCLMAAMSDADLDLYLERNEQLTPLTEKTITDRGELRKEVARIRDRGYAIDDEEQEIGVRCAATWVRRIDNFAVSVSGPPSRMTEQFIGSTVGPALTDAMESLTEILTNTGTRGQ